MAEKEITVKVHSFDSWDDPVKLRDFMGTLASVMSEIPVEHHDDVIIVATECDGEAQVQLRYKRPETPEEIADREAVAARYARTREALERNEYTRLHAKYGDAK
jgi:hypothetical protein